MSTVLGSPDALDSAWDGVLAQAVASSDALVFGVFDANGDLRAHNRGMAGLLSLGQGDHEPASFLRNPTLQELLDQPISPDPVFEGVLTFGDAGQNNLSINGVAYRGSTGVLIVGEFDVLELDQFNRKMAELNQEHSRLQRELMREKRSLNQTLRELRETQAMLVHAEKMNSLGKLVAGVAHEVNNPMAFVASNVHSLRGALVEIQKAYLELERLVGEVEDSDLAVAAAAVREQHDLTFLFEDLQDLCVGSMEGLERIKKIVADLRVFSRLDEAERKEIDLTASIQSTLNIAGAELKNRDIEVRVELENLPSLMCYPAELNQVFMNLIVNAAQAMSDGGVLAIRGRIEERETVLEFEDNGEGIPDDVLPRIFDPFFTTKPVGMGTGLGLSLAYKIVTDRHQGRLEVHSVVGAGTVFTMRLPHQVELP